jgi:O-antigen ligase
MMARAYQELIKYGALNFVILLGMSLPLTPLTRARRAWVMYIMILAFLLSGYLWAPIQFSASAMSTTEERVKGFLVNGNTFALTAMLLLFFGDENRTGRLIKVLNQALVLFLIYLSHTSGALLGYLAGMLYRFIFGKSRFPVIVRWAAVAAGLILAAAIFVSIPPKTFKVVDATTMKIKIASDNIDRVLSDKPIDFYGFIEKNGQDVTSAVWRLYHWNLILNKFRDSSLDKILFGYGIGTMESLFYLKAHNDYLRFLFQTGMIGLLLNLLVWGTLYRRMEVSYRWVAVMIAVFCISENNYDNFPAMSLLAFYMLGARRRGQDKLPNPNPPDDLHNRAVSLHVPE